MDDSARSLEITGSLKLPLRELEISASTSGGPGGQHVNRVATAVEVRLDIHASSLPEDLKRRLLARSDQRLSQAGVLLIRASNHRSQKRNRADALARLQKLLTQAAQKPARRRPTRPSRRAREKRLSAKKKRGELKRGRSKNWE